MVPASADLVVSVEDASGARALLARAGVHAPSLTPEAIGSALRERVGIDLLAEPAAWGLSPRGARMLVFSRSGAGLIAPVKDAPAAKKMLASWIAGKANRAGRIAGARLLTASGRDPSALLAAMARPAALQRDLAARAKGPLWVWAALEDPLRGMVLAVDASATGLSARGLATAAQPILTGAAPAGCDGTIACIRAGLGPAGRTALAKLMTVLAGSSQPALDRASRAEERLEAIEVRELSDPRSLPRALRLVPVFDGPESAGPALEAHIDLAAVDSALTTMTPLDALRGGLAASAFAAHLVYGRLLRNSGPLTLSATAGGNTADLALHLPLR